MELVTTFGQWVKLRRKSLDITQGQLAQQVGCSPAAIKKIEANDRRPSRQIALLLAGQLQLSAEQRDIFVRVARGELPVERLALPRSAAPEDVYQGHPQPAAAVPAPSLAARTRIPHPVTPLIGREQELAEIIRLVRDPQCRLLTLTGIGGTGKTRLAVEAALKLKELFADGVYFVSLAGFDSPSLITQAVGGALGMVFSGPGEARIQLFHFLQRKQVLLVLDNLEHLLDGVDLLGELLPFAPEVKLLATSREQLHLQAEWVFEVRGLPVPQSGQVEAIESSSAARLFIQRARQTGYGLAVKDRDYGAIGQICQMVQGLPLAIELAARWTRTLSCAEIAREIERGLEFLATDTRDVAPRDVSHRHRSLQAVFDHSWELLTHEERAVLKKLSVFRGGFGREAAEQVAGASLSLLSALIDKSLLWRGESNRYDLHDLIRQYLEARLAEDEAERRVAYSGHSRFFLTLLQKSEPLLRSPRQKEALANLDVDLDNIRLAWSRAVEGDMPDLLCEAAEPLYYYYELHQSFKEAESLFGRAADWLRARLKGLEPVTSEQEKERLDITLACLLNFQAFFNMRLGSNQQALALFEASLGTLRRRITPESPRDAFPLAFALVHIGVVSWAMGDFDLAAERMEEALPLSGILEPEQVWLRGLALGFLGGVWHDRGDYQKAYNYLREAVTLLRSAGDPYLVMFIGIYYSRTLMVLNRFEEAQAQLEEGLRGVQETGNRWLMALGLEYLARAARLLENDHEARRLMEESVQLHREVGDPWSLALALIELSRSKLQSADFDSAEQHALEALKITAETGSLPSGMESLGILAAICAEQGSHGEALCLVEHILQHPSSKQDTRDQAQKLAETIAMRLSPDVLQAEQNTALPERFVLLMKYRFGICLPPVFVTG